MKKSTIIILSVLGVLLLFGVIFASTIIGKRNQFVAAEEAITANWAQVENVLKRRSDLIPNLVNTVKGIRDQEKDVFQGIADARAKLAGAESRGERIDAERQVGSALSRLLVVVERYPELRSSQNFSRLQDELAGTENRIAVERRRYNESIREYNVMIRQFPGNVVASMFGFEKNDEYFEVSEAEQAVPEVNFN